tara:strand:- start:4484 stop:5173 length:690 start_codon:yes stop_codon:yes gene_type:complete
MADEYVVRIVLDGIDNASDDVDRVEHKVGGLTQTITESDARMLMYAGSAALVAGSLNQMTGGLRKALNASRELGYINDRVYEKVNTQVLKFEIFAGVMEFLATTFIVGAYAIKGYNKLLKPLITRGMAAAATLRGAGLAAGTLLGFLGTMISIIGVLLFVFIAFDDKIKSVLMRLHKFGEEADYANRALQGLIDGVNGFKDAVGRLGDDAMDNINSKFRADWVGAGSLA